jgi:hypothetical protein
MGDVCVCVCVCVGGGLTLRFASKSSKRSAIGVADGDTACPWATVACEP